MADIRKLAPLILKWEGLFVHDPADAGGPTHMGVTLKRLIESEFDKNKDGLVNIADLKALNEHDVIYCFLKPFYWDRWQADHIRNQSIANLLVDWVWMSGKAGINIPQKVLGVKVDGMVGNQTLQAVNEHPNPELLYEKLKSERKSFIERICNARPANNRFRKGWLNRLADFKFACILILLVVSLSWGGCKSTAQLGNVAVTQQATTLNTNEQQEVSAKMHNQQETVTSWEEIVIIASDSLPVVITALLHDSVKPSKGIYLRKSVHQIKTNKQHELALESVSNATAQVTNQQQTIEQPTYNSFKLKLFLIVIAFILLSVFFLAYKFSPFFRKCLLF